MTEHCNRTLLGFAAAYLALLPTNAATFARSLTFGVSGVCALILVVLSLRGRAPRVPYVGTPILLPLLLWVGWSTASLAWSVEPSYSSGQLAREVMDSLLAVLIFYMAPYNARALRVLVTCAFASLVVFALLSFAMDWRGNWDAGVSHNGVGPWSTWLVLIAPLLFLLIAPKPIGYGRRPASIAIALLLLVLIIFCARMTDNRIVWIALSAVFGAASLIAALRWREPLTRRPVRFILPLLALLVVLAVAFVDAVKERASIYPRDVTVAATIENDPRVALWEHLRVRIGERPWLGYGFGRLILAEPMSRELDNPLLTHAHNVFASQWLQTGFIGMAAFALFVAGLLWRYARFVRAPDEALAIVGLVGITLITGWLVKNVTDDFLFRSNAKEFWALTTMLLGYGVRRAQRLRKDVPAA
ncbi:MAG TPA: O-antigen ligase family protein [Casimicrobiaceae bacterium]|nr:O-antigen ligase family protein [Casimicrobiaceae bacterium]